MTQSSPDLHGITSSPEPVRPARNHFSPVNVSKDTPPVDKIVSSSAEADPDKRAIPRNSSVCILGRQPALGLAELESLYGADKVRSVGGVAALIDLDPPQIDFSRLGGTVKFCKVLTILDTTDWNKLQAFLEENVAPHVAYLPEGKMKLGLSAIGLSVSVQRLNATGLSLKKVIKKTGRSIRVVPSTTLMLNSAQVLHNQLTSALGWELIFVRDGEKTILVQNIAEQDIAAYAKRDQGRPKRDARVGMLPPKLAQIITNLAAGPAEPVDPTCGPHGPKDRTLLDPFCGTGVLLQEALLMGYTAYGTDIDERMVEYSQVNLEWLGEQFKISNFKFQIEPGDATNHHWTPPIDIVAGETYLGRPFTTTPPPNTLQETIADTNLILKRSLQNIAKQIKPGTRLCLAMPAWKIPQSFKHLPLLDSLPDMGYTRASFVHVDTEDLIYHREGQIVARELVVLIRK